MRAGDRIGDRFTVEAKAGAGAMGVVYRARDLASARVVAVKLLKSDDADSLERFAREASVLASLRHPCIVEYVTHGRTESGDPYLAMEWLEGHNLKEALAARRFTFVEIIDVAMAIAGALVPAHARGIIHRDLKPANVFLVGGSAQRLKVVDFGIARVGGAGTLTGTGAALGTPAYMSPEQVSRARHVDARSDLFSLGSIVFLCVTGRPPFPAEDAVAIMLALATTHAPPVRSVAPGTPPKLAAVIDWMLQSDPARRPPDATTVLRALADAREEATSFGVAPSVDTTIGSGTVPSGAPFGAPTFGGPTNATLPGATAPAREAPRSVGTLVLGLAAAGVLVLAGVGAGLYLGLGSARTAHESRAASPTATSAKETSSLPDNMRAMLCPPDALACEKSPARDPTSADADELLAFARAAAKRQDPTAEVFAINITGLSADGLDLTHGKTIVVSFTHGIMVNFFFDLAPVKRTTEFASMGTVELGCSLAELYRRLHAAGIPGPAVVGITSQSIVAYPDGGSASNMVTLDTKTCAKAL